MKTALLSVSDKTGIAIFAQKLEKLGFRIISTGGTFRTLKKHHLKNLIEVSDFTKFPEGLDGRIKTLTPQVFGGILNLRNENSHQEFCQTNQIENIDLVVVNLYPFKETYENIDKNFEDKVENIDIGGPSMIRAAAKNYEFCAPIVDPTDYNHVVEQYEKEGDLNLEFRKELATKVFEMTANYDLLIAKFWAENTKISEEKGALRYGENPHQKAVTLRDPFAKGANLIGAKVLNGKPLSFNNFGDANGALELAMSFKEPFAAIIKHATPCGAAIGETVEEAFDKAYKADSISAFGGVIAINREITEELARKIVSFFNEIVLAPKISDEALKVFQEKPNLRVLEISNFDQVTPDISLKHVRGGILVQDLDLFLPDFQNLETATKQEPTQQERLDLEIAWKIVKIVKSNAIAVVKNGIMLGKGGGQTSRVDAMEIALSHAGEQSKGAVLASDAFFPFPDAIEKAGEYGISSIIQPGGAKNDSLVFEKSDSLNISMVLTKTRAFLH
ncbi:bifunctional phosphoribosylaminoimidazolecarboxamide formyltransferase/IMP cyclohydrolase [Candidatus Gracilibacteria bacterium]|nr:bifunctional phosphoribosylaminoimidazolecarboxamide formyltransferase/IMP cyclohydrolase [Candidatus Gracilibacteria bacterium]